MDKTSHSILFEYIRNSLINNRLPEDDPYRETRGTREAFELLTNIVLYGDENDINEIEKMILGIREYQKTVKGTINVTR